MTASPAAPHCPHLEGQQHLAHDTLSTRRRAELAVCDAQPQRAALRVCLAADDVRLHLVHLETHAALQAGRVEVAHQQRAVGAQHKAAARAVRHEVDLQVKCAAAEKHNSSSSSSSLGEQVVSSMVVRPRSSTQ
jgi:hypothetical protein